MSEPLGVITKYMQASFNFIHGQLGNEKAYNYIAENATWLAIGALSTGAVGFISYKLFTAMPECLANADEKQLKQMLETAKVSTGHFSGRQIHFATESASFTEVSKKIQELYQKNQAVVAMQKKKADYDSKVMPTYRGRGVVNLALTLVTLAANVADTPVPSLTPTEKTGVKNAIQWRRDRSNHLEKLFKDSQKHVDSASYFGQLWDKALDRARGSSWREGELLERQENLFKQLSS